MTGGAAYCMFFFIMHCLLLTRRQFHVDRGEGETVPAIGTFLTSGLGNGLCFYELNISAVRGNSICLSPAIFVKRSTSAVIIRNHGFGQNTRKERLTSNSFAIEGDVHNPMGIYLRHSSKGLQMASVPFEYTILCLAVAIEI